MQEVLANRDLIVEIMAYTWKGTLAALGRTCQMFKDPALDSLWREMSSLDPLYMCLPSDVCAKNVIGGLVLRGRIPDKQADWKRFDMYAARIHVLAFRPGSGLRPTLLRLLKAYFPGPAPVLRKLSVRRLLHVCSEGELALCVSTLVHPNLHALEIYSSFEDSMAAALGHAQLSCPNLRSLIISGTADVLPLMGRFAQLRVLVYNSPEGAIIDAPSIILLSQLPHLQNLKISSKVTATSFRHDVPLSNAIGAFFPALEELTLEDVSHLQTLSRLLQLIESPSMRLISISYQLSGVPKSDTLALSSGLSSHTCLTTLHLTNRSPPSDAVTVADFEPLIRLTNLQEARFVDIMTDRNVSTSSAIPQLTSTWVKVQSLHIECSVWHDPDSKNLHAPSLERLLKHFAAKLPHLHDLHLAVLADSAISTFFLRFKKDLLTPRITHPLHLTLQPVSALQSKADPFTVAVYISDTYPNINIVFNGAEAALQRPEITERNKSMASAWKNVQNLVKKLAAIRDTERERVGLEMLRILNSDPAE
ncbi:uncharacterized protein PHACADRAFT_136048 [Phanerochaete carnosa HHB-10118-sp]|uniref:F-box domain-containing protein n=1 Tax=Phanerochaete carnosa (strain HHB-10118-sp) TaxID=650164 RepID=K5WHV5_PHACS|nr:uncharacterized protein PHACADRAFT_136048 [Phanerochaete carnosa HHB-10118-sp]EKM58930.1 hypothetical protein PHACADRAFT_136048 [Phanerochaete carnosa HHB-10118-sp]